MTSSNSTSLVSESRSSWSSPSIPLIDASDSAGCMFLFGRPVAEDTDTASKSEEP